MNLKPISETVIITLCDEILFNSQPQQNGTYQTHYETTFAFNFLISPLYFDTSLRRKGLNFSSLVDVIEHIINA